MGYGRGNQNVMGNEEVTPWINEETFGGDM